MEYLYRVWENFQFAFGKVHFKVTDIVEILILTFLIYHILVWIQKSRAQVLLKGVFVIFVFIFLAAMLHMTTILWIAKNIFGIAMTAIVIIFQPELRKALETLGKTELFEKLRLFDRSSEEGRFTDKTLQAILNACTVMSKAKTGALIVLERNQSLNDYVNTGIMIDAVVSGQLLVNIFEHNTPLHDGAAVIRGDRVLAATCYLPLSENRELGKELGTRHRAALGASENTDALIVVVSEETGAISVARDGVLHRNLGTDGLQEQLVQFQEKRTEDSETVKTIINRWKGTK